MSTFTLSAERWVKTYSLAAFIGPEIYHMQRTKEGGSKQTGTLYGVRLGYDHVCRYKWYWGIDGLWARGTLTGRDGRKDRIKSEFTDSNVEARLGYTFQFKYWRCASFTPYFGGGYFWEENCYEKPSPLRVHFINRFSYIPFGFLSQIFITPSFSCGLNLKVRYIIDGEQKATHDSKNGNSIQHYDEKLQYRVEVPLSYFFCYRSYSLGISLVPFYEYRSYGHRANYPFNFLETNLRLYGATMKLFYLF